MIVTVTGPRSDTAPPVAALSVRGDARRTVAPDFALLDCRLSVIRTSKRDALQVAAGVLESLENDLAGLGAVPLTASSERAPMTWSAQSISTQDVHEFDEATGRHGPTGRVAAEVPVRIGVRALDRLAAVGTVLAGHDRLAVSFVSWHVDPDNAEWSAVRADAIHAAIAKGRDYAAALGGTLLRIEHIADVGLLEGGGDSARMSWVTQAAGMSPGGEPGAPSLDPVPQELIATIDARFVTSVAALTEL